MENDLKRKTTQGSREITSLKVLLARITWFFLAPAAILFLTARIIATGSGWLTFYDAGFFIAVGVTIGARWLEQRSGQGTTADGAPSTWEDFRRYSLCLLPLAAAVWVVANVLGNHVLAN